MSLKGQKAMQTDQHLTRADAAYEAYRTQRFFGALNGLRFLCIVAVMWHHGPARAALENPFHLWGRGFLGVDFFFVLSGFLITTMLLREEAQAGRFSLRDFYWRRVLRIVPVYFLVVTLVGSYYIFVKGESHLLEIWLYYYMFLSNFLTSDIPLLSITWSLAVEEQYYLVWPVLLLLLPVSGWVRPIVLMGAIILCVLSSAGQIGGFGIEVVETEHALWRLPAASYAAILLGALCAMVLHHPGGFVLVWRGLGHPMAPVGCFALLVGLLLSAPSALTGWMFFGVHLAMALCLMSLVMREDHILARPLAWRPVARIGEISYGLYLYHLIGRHVSVELGQALGLGPWAMSVIFFLASVLIAEVSFRSFEAYFLQFKHKAPWHVPRESD